MAGAQFQYDEVGNTFYYFVVSFYALLLIPATFYFWPRDKKTDDKDSKAQCRCEGCETKAERRLAAQPWQKKKQIFIKVLLFIFWVIFAVLVYKVTQLKIDHEEYDPYIILGVDRGADQAEIKKRYRELSKTMHPDRGGDAVQFDRIAKAHQALTDEESRKNWEEHGNPDGPAATTFGIALPKWLVSKEYGVWVLAAYGFIFMVILPVGVGIWWYNSIKYSVDQVLMDTTQLFGYMFHKTRQMPIKRVLMVLGSSFEFWKQYNKEIVERESDDREIPLLIKELPNLNEKNKERPLCLPYSVKARALIHAHLGRIPLATDALEKDRAYVIRKCPILIQEMVQVVSQLVMYALSGRMSQSRMPLIETVENTIRVLPMVVQALWDTRSPLLQLPHVSEDMLRHMVNKKRRIKTCSDLAAVEDSERRMLLRNLSDDQYRDVLHVLKMMPRISMDCHVEVQGEDDKHDITVGSVVTVKVNLTRKSLLDSPVPSYEESGTGGDHAEEEEEKEKNGDGQDDDSAAQSQKQQRKPWEKQKKKKGGKPNKNKPKPKPPAKTPTAKPTDAPSASTATGDDSAANTDSPKPSRDQKQHDKKEKKSQRENDDEDGSDDDRSKDSEGTTSASDEEGSVKNFELPHDDDNDDDHDDDDLVFDDELVKKELVLETKSKITHPVHSPYFPEEKYEWWWVYLYDKKTKSLINTPVHCTTLVNEETVDLKFPAPSKPGNYSYTVAVRSDSYMDCDTSKEIKLKVLEERTVTSHPQWDFADEDEEHKSDSEHSDASEYTEGEEDDD